MCSGYLQMYLFGLQIWLVICFCLTSQMTNLLLFSLQIHTVRSRFVSAGHSHFYKHTNAQIQKYINTQICKYTQIDQVSRRPFSSVISLNLRRGILLTRYLCSHTNILYWQNGSFKFMHLFEIWFKTNSCRKYVNMILL